MDEIVRLIQTAEKKTPVKVYVRANRPLHFENCHVFTGADMIVMGDYGDIEPVLARNADAIEDMVIECDRRNSALPLLDVKPLHARIEPGAILRAGVSVGDGAVIMMGAILNVGAAVGEGTLIDMGAVLGGRAGRQTHIVLFPRTRERAFTQMTRGRGWIVSRGGKAGDTREGMRARVRVARGGADAKAADARGAMRRGPCAVGRLMC